jgi:hypothetical protein
MKMTIRKVVLADTFLVQNNFIPNLRNNVFLPALGIDFLFIFALVLFIVYTSFTFSIPESPLAWLRNIKAIISAE